VGQINASFTAILISIGQLDSVMLKGHFESAGASIKVGAADCLFPVAELDATVHKYRDAQLALDAVYVERAIIHAST